MNRSPLSYLLLAPALAATMGAGCNPPTCGPGTKQVQSSSGDVRCLPADVQPSTGFQCDVDAGAQVVAGICVSHVTCDPQTTAYDPVSGLCIGKGGGLPPCTQGAGKACLNGTIRQFVENAPLTAPVQVNLFLNPLSFLANPTTTRPDFTVTTDANGNFIFNSFDPPGSGLIAFSTTDTAGTLQQTAVGGQNIAADKYTIDGYTVPKTLVASWTAAGGIDYDAKGAYIPQYFCDPVPSPQKATATETTKAGLVKVIEDMVTPATVKYLNAATYTLDPALTSTSVTTGAGLMPGSTGTHTYSGSGGTCTTGTSWEALLGASPPHAVFITRFHRM